MAVARTVWLLVTLVTYITACVSGVNNDIYVAANATRGPGVITLCAGTFTGACGVATLYPGVTLVGAGMSQTVIDCGFVGRPFYLFPGVVVANLTITRGTSPSDGGCLFAATADLTLQNVALTYCRGGDNGLGAARGAAVSQPGDLSWTGSLTVDGCVFAYNFIQAAVAANAYGTAIFSNARNVVIRNTTFVSNNHVGTGTVYLYGNSTAGSVTVSGCTFFNNSNAVSAALAAIKYGTVSYTGSLMNGNIKDSSTQFTGGLYLLSVTNADISNSMFQANTVTQAGEGGGMTINCVGYTTITNCTFVNNVAGDLGGAASFQYSGVVTIKNSTFLNNSLPTRFDGQGGGLGLIAVTTTNIISSTFKNNYAVVRGGAFICAGLYSRFLNVQDTLIQGNNASEGSGLYMQTPAGTSFALTVTRTTFADQTANVWGAGIFVTGNATVVVTVQDSIFRNLRTLAGSGEPRQQFSAIAVIEAGWSATPTSVIIDGTQFISNTGDWTTATSLGAFGFVSVDSVLMTRSNCTQSGGHVACGFVVYCPNVTIVDTSFSDNSPQTALLVFNYVDYLMLDRVVVERTASTATSACIGWQTPTAVWVRNSRFAYNSAHGVLLTTGGTLTIEGTTFQSNYNPLGNGGVLDHLSGAVNVIINNSTFDSNHCVANGGVLSILSGGLTVTGATVFSNNYAVGTGGSIYHAAGSSPSIAQDTVFFNNVAQGSTSRMDADFTGVTGCSVTGAVGWNFTSGCPGAPGYVCPVQCPSHLHEFPSASVTCSGGVLSTVSCLPNSIGVIRMGGIITASASAYGTRGTPTPTNAMPRRTLGTVFHTPLLPYQAIIHGGVGSYQNGSYTTMDDTWLVNTTVFGAPTFTWIAGSNAAAWLTGPDFVNGHPSAMSGAAAWVDGTTGYMFGGYGLTMASGAWAACQLATLWTIDLLHPLNGWTYRGGNSTRNGSFGVRGVASPTNWPSANNELQVFRIPDVIPHGTFIYGGCGYPMTGTPDFTSDMWLFDSTTFLWTWIRGSGIADEQPHYGTLNTPDINSTPGARCESTTWSTNDTMYLFGGWVASSSQQTNDLWMATWSNATGNVTWTWIAGPQTKNDNGTIVADTTVRCSTCIPRARGTGLGVFMPGLRALGFPTSLFLYGGYVMNMPSNGLINDLWDLQPTAGAYTWLAGYSQHTNTMATAATFSTPFPVQLPSSRNKMQGWPDHARPGVFYAMGGTGWIGNTETASGEQTAYSMFDKVYLFAPAVVEVNVPFLVSIVIGKNLQNSTNVTVSNVRWQVSSATPTAYSNGFSNSVANISVAGVAGIVNTTRLTLSVLLWDYLNATTTIAVKCTYGCRQCTGIGVTSNVCQLCDASVGYWFSPTLGRCVDNCGAGYYAPPSSPNCTLCDPACTICASSGTYVSAPSVCACNTAANYGNYGGSCTPCGPMSGRYFSGPGTCADCIGITECAVLPVTCTTGSNSVCAGCVPGKRLGSGAHSCVACSTCLATEYRTAPCTNASDATCATCTQCGVGALSLTFTLSPCNATGDAVCAPCGPVANCTTPGSCTATASQCLACQGGFYLQDQPIGTQDICAPCPPCPLGQFTAHNCTATTAAICISCQSGCADCSSLGLEARECRACDESIGFRWNLDHSTCVNDCPAGQWWAHRNATGDEAPAQCLLCTPGCTTCTAYGLGVVSLEEGVNASCLACSEKDGYLISSDGSQCVHGCPPGDFQNKTATPLRCESCQGIPCAAGNYKYCTDDTNAQCVACTKGCASCTGDGLDTNGYCLTCDETVGYALDADSGLCVPCARNCTLCHGSPTTCTACAEGFGTPPECAPVCESPGCMGCLDTNACGLCASTYTGADCKSCSGLAAVGALYPDCEAARVTDTVSTGGVVGGLALLVLVVFALAVRSPLPVFYSGIQKITTPAAVIPFQLDFILTTRKLRLVLQPPIEIVSSYLEGHQLMPQSLVLAPGDEFEKGQVGIDIHLTQKQAKTFLAGRYHVDVSVDAGAGPVVTKQPLHIPMRTNLPNMVACFTILLDFIQLSSFVFGKNIAWWSQDPVPGVLKYSLLILPPVMGLWYAIFWALAGIALVWAIFVVIIKTGLDERLSRCCGNRILVPIYGTFMPIVGQTLFLPIISVMLGVMSCSRAVTATDPHASYFANFDANVVCWTKEHIVYVIVAILVILIFYPMAIYTLPLWQTTNTKLDVRYFPSFLIASGQVKFILAVTGQMFSTVPFVQSILLIVLCLPVVVLGWRRPVSVIHAVHIPVLTSYIGVGWVGLASIVALFFPGKLISSAILYGGWGALLLLCIALSLRSAPPPDEVKHDDDAVLAVRRVMRGTETHHGDAGAAYAPVDGEPVPFGTAVVMGDMSKPVEDTKKQHESDVLDDDEFAAIDAITVPGAVGEAKETPKPETPPAPTPLTATAKAPAKKTPAAKTAAAKAPAKAPAAGETDSPSSAAKEAPATKEPPAAKEAPLTREAPALKETPAAKEAAHAPSSKSPALAAKSSPTAAAAASTDSKPEDSAPASKAPATKSAATAAKPAAKPAALAEAPVSAPSAGGAAVSDAPAPAKKAAAAATTRQPANLAKK